MFKELTANDLMRKLKVTKIQPDISHLTDNQKQVIEHLVAVAGIIKELFIFQKDPSYIRLLEEIDSVGNPDLKKIFYLMNGAYNEFDDTFFIQGAERCQKSGFYPDDLTKEEWDDFIINNPQLKEQFISPYTVIQRDKKGGLLAVPYSEYYKKYLSKSSKLLYKAAEYADNFYVKSYINALANAFVTNDFTEADIRWIQLTDNDIEPLLGPHEFYEDKFLGYKAAFTAFIAIKNRVQFKKLEILLKMSESIQSILPVPINYKRNKIEKLSQIVVVDLIYATGDGSGPIQTAAFNLPNSQKIRNEFGGKKVFFHNIIQAKFDSVMKGLSGILLGENDDDKVTFSAYFNHILLHEISHGLGIGLIKDDKGGFYSVSYFLKELYSVIEETKADVMGMFALFYLIKQCIIVDTNFIESSMTYVVSLLRGIRFGKDNAHGISSVMQWNYLVRDGALIVNESTLKISIDLHKIEKTIEKMLTVILTIQGEGDYEKCKVFIDDLSVSGDILNEIINKIDAVPVDVLPYYPLVGEKEPFTN